MQEKYEVLLRNVKAEKYECISFDIFDTLIYRPFFRPTDLFYFLDKKFEKIFPACGISFYKIRMDGEAGARHFFRQRDERIEDLTLTEIYDYISETYHLNPEICRELMEYEKQLELKYTFERKSAKRVYQAAVEAGKKIIFVSDMYLERETIQEILEKNGYTKYDELFLSSERRLLKHTGNLYSVVLKKMGILPERIFHIGDNWESDAVRAREQGITAAHYPKAMDVFFNTDGQYQTGRSGDIVKGICGGVINYEKVEQSIGYGAMIAMTANMYFDNPFIEYREGSLFNKDPYLVGYYAVGMHLAGLMQWLDQIITQGKYTSIVFTSRDGWLPMQAYRIYRRIRPELPEETYIYVSRRALMSVILGEKIDFYDLPISRENYSPKKLYELLSFCVERGGESCFRGECEKNGIPYTENFYDAEGLRRTVGIFLQHCYSEDMHQREKGMAKEYLQRVGDHGLLFDMGYSGRIHAAICKVTGKKLDAAFIHSDVEKHYQMARCSNFRIYDFYDMIPWMSDFVREYMLSEVGPSCIGYRAEEAGVLPVFEEHVSDASFCRTAEQAGQGALDFLSQLYDIFYDDFAYLTFKSHEVSLPFEGFLRYASKIDFEIFEGVRFEDAVYGGEKAFRMEKMIQDCLKWLPVYAKEGSWDQRFDD